MDRLGQRVYQALETKGARCHVYNSIPVSHDVNNGFAGKRHLLLNLLQNILFWLLSNTIHSCENTEDTVQVLKVAEVLSGLWVI